MNTLTLSGPDVLRRWTRLLKWRVLYRGASAPLGVFGAPNAGKSSLVNAFCEDWNGEPVSRVSALPHETRNVRTKRRVVLSDGVEELLVDVMDTPGLADRVTATELEVFHDMSPREAAARAQEAVAGMTEAIGALEKAEGLLLVVDATADPLAQVNRVILTSARARRTPVVIVANKIDLPDARPERVQEAFGAMYPVVPVSAVTRENLRDLYSVMCRVFD